jgi:hypothetical protein
MSKINFFNGFHFIPIVIVFLKDYSDISYITILNKFKNYSFISLDKIEYFNKTIDYITYFKLNIFHK